MLKILRNKNWLSEDTRKKIYNKGEKFGERFNIPKLIDRINKYGSENPGKVFFLIFCGIIFSFIVGSLYPKPKIFYQRESIPVNSLKSTDIETNIDKELKQEIISLYEEMEFLTDTISKIMEKSIITPEDSVFVIEKFSRLEVLDNILNQKFNEE